MTDRDRLVELIANADIHDSYECKLCTKKDTSCTCCGAEKLTDHILADGWIRPPCKVGDKVYVIERCSCFETYANECSKRITSATKYLKRVRLQDRKHHSRKIRCLKLFARPFKVNMLNAIGKTVFLTKEEAEEKLKELNDNGN